MNRVVRSGFCPCVQGPGGMLARERACWDLMAALEVSGQLNSTRSSEDSLLM